MCLLIFLMLLRLKIWSFLKLRLFKIETDKPYIVFMIRIENMLIIQVSLSIWLMLSFL